jgi:uncharacterized protein YeaO (DUF488 family)
MRFRPSAMRKGATMSVSNGGRIRIRRIYDDPDGGTYRVLVDRLWPRGIKRDAATLDHWAKDAAPSAELRRWYGHDPARFDEFARRYQAELSRPPASIAVAELRGLTRRRVVTLLTATRDIEHSGARVLRDHLRSRR